MRGREMGCRRLVRYLQVAIRARECTPKSSRRCAKSASISPRLPRRNDTRSRPAAQVLVTMGCGDQCPYVPGAKRDDWPLDDPKGKPIEKVRESATRFAAGFDSSSMLRGWHSGPNRVSAQPGAAGTVGAIRS